MNMSDLAAMAAQRAQQQQQQFHQQQQQQPSPVVVGGYSNPHPTIEEEAPDLKTPTAEELSMQGTLKVNSLYTCT